MIMRGAILLMAVILGMAVDGCSAPENERNVIAPPPPVPQRAEIPPAPPPGPAATTTEIKPDAGATAAAPAASAPEPPQSAPQSPPQSAPIPPAAPAVKAEPMVAGAPAKPAFGSAPASRFGLQLAAYWNKEEAPQGWASIRSAHPSLAGKTPYLAEGKSRDGKTFWRLIATGFASPKDAEEICAALKKRRVGCVAVRL